MTSLNKNTFSNNNATIITTNISEHIQNDILTNLTARCDAHIAKLNATKTVKLADDNPFAKYL